MPATLSVSRSIFIAAPPERVWSVLTDPQKIAVWLTEFRFTSLTAGARFEMPTGEGETAPGIFVTIDPPHTFAFRWTAEKGHDGMTLVTFILAPVSGGTRVTVTESEFELLDAAHRKAPFERNSEGWGYALDGLAKLAEEGS